MRLHTTAHARTRLRLSARRPEHSDAPRVICVFLFTVIREIPMSQIVYLLGDRDADTGRRYVCYCTHHTNRTSSIASRSIVSHALTKSTRGSPEQSAARVRPSSALLRSRALVRGESPISGAFALSAGGRVRESRRKCNQRDLHSSDSTQLKHACAECDIKQHYIAVCLRTSTHTPHATVPASLSISQRNVR